jgi:regulatory protein
MGSARPPKKLDSDGLWDHALRLLGRRAHSVGELRTKLARRADSQATLGSVVARLREYGLVDDKQFSDAFAVARLQNNGFGKFRVLRDLRGRKVSATVAENAVAQTFAGTDEQELAAQFLQRKYRGKNLALFLKEEKNLASAYRRLRTGGFSSSASMSVLKRFSRAVEEWEEPEELE